MKKPLVNIVDIGPIIGLFGGRSIFQWLSLENGAVYSFNRTDTDFTKITSDEIYLSPGLVYKKNEEAQRA